MKKSIRIFWAIFLGGLGLFVLVIIFAMLGVFGKMPSLKQLENPSIMQASEVYATDGTLMGKYYRERGNRSNVNYRDIFRHVLDGLIATEAESFEDHSAIDFKRTIAAIVTFGQNGGGSTVAQQLANALLTGQGSRNIATRVIGKVNENVDAIRVERNFTKEGLSRLYLNAVPLGENILGIRRAARTFFQKEPERLTVSE